MVFNDVVERGVPRATEAQIDLTKALSERLATCSARELARVSGWGRTTVNEIKHARQLPTSQQLEDLLMAAGATRDEVDQWLGRLEEASATGSSNGGPQSGGGRRSKRRWMKWLVVVVSVVALAATGWWWRASSRQVVAIAGEVSCTSGNHVVGIWVTSGGGGSFARIRPGNGPSVFYNASTDLSQYRLNVGCGGTPSQWGAEARSPELSGEYLRLSCDDSPAAISQAPYFGRCVPAG